MSAQEIFKKAKDGGWQDHYDALGCEVSALEHAVNDFLFWQALGRSMGWKENYHRTNSGTEPMREHKECTRFCKWGYVKYWHGLVDHLDDGGTIEEYFKGL